MFVWVGLETRVWIELFANSASMKIICYFYANNCEVLKLPVLRKKNIV